MKLSIRTMGAEDLAAVMAIEQAVPEAPHWSRHAYEDCTKADTTGGLKRTGLVAEVNGQVGGFAVLKLVADVCELESIVVSGEVRKRGVGRVLVEASSAWARAMGASRLELEVRASNQVAIEFYRRLGLQVEGRRPRYYADPVEDALLMGKSLSGPAQT